MKWLSTAVQVKEVIVYKSTAANVFANLALEEWIIKNVDLKARRILFLWRNTPSVVIGRHQNPWEEANVPLTNERHVALARRRSGGGAVYHDLGNLNVTVFSHRHDYHRPRNLELVCDAINMVWGAGLHSNQRDDIICNGRWKVSGSSARLTKNSAYHHFTLLLNADQDNLHSLLRPHPQLHPSSSTATASQRSEVINLCTLYPRMSHDAVSAVIAEQFYAVHRVHDNRRVIQVDPLSEQNFPGISETIKELESWDWVYGKTPKFSISAQETFGFGGVELSADLVGGVLQNTSLRQTSGEDTLSQQALSTLPSMLNGKRFCRMEVLSCLEAVGTREEEKAIVAWISQLS